MSDEAGAPSRVVGPDEVRRALRMFRFVHALPKDGGGSSLQIAFRVLDERAARELLELLGLLATTRPFELQRSEVGPSSGSVVSAAVTSATLLPGAEVLRTPLVRLQLWNETARSAGLYEVTAGLIARAAEIETRLTAMGLDRHPRQTGLLGFAE